MKSVYKKLVSFNDAVALARENLKPLSGTERIPITEGTGRILSGNVSAPRNNPPFNRSTMDGFAVRARDIAGISEAEPAVLPVVGESFIGQARKRMEGERCCFRISTGAIIPEGADSVVKVEDTEDIGNGKVRIMESVSSGTNIAEAGSDISCGELLMLPGKEIDTNDIAVMASLGIHEIEVYRKLRVSVISTGNELISHTQPYREGSISDANGIALCNELGSYRFIEATYAGIVNDDYGEIKGTIENCLAGSDIVILSGGSSAGESDLVYRIIDEMEPGMVFHGVLVKPGLPTALGRSGAKVVIGLPGFPVSSMMIFRSIFLKAILNAGRLELETAPGKGVLAVNLKLEMGKQNLIPVTVSKGARQRVYPVTGLSGSISRFISTAGFISLEGNTKFLDAGTEVEVIRWSQDFEDNRPVISGMLVQVNPGSGMMESLPSMKYARMEPRNSLKSLKNGDSVLSTFYFTRGFPIDAYIRSEIGTESYFLYAGNTVEIGVECPNGIKSMEEVLDALEKGDTLGGPALKFLESIASDNKTLEGLIQATRGNLASYSPSCLHGNTENMPTGNATFSITMQTQKALEGRRWIRAFEIVPAFVTLQKDFVERNTMLKGKLTPLGP